MKGHFTDNWTELYNPNVDYPIQSNSDYTLVYSLNADGNGVTLGYQIDFQVQALIGAVHRGYNASATDQLEMYPYVFSGEISDWSNTQTITIPSTSTSLVSTPTVPEMPYYALTIGLVFGITTAIALISKNHLMFSKRS
jgi:hypothetical protein